MALTSTLFPSAVSHHIHILDCVEMLNVISAGSVDLIVTSPPYAQQRAKQYGGVSADHYLEWFLERSDVFRQALKSAGSFVLNIKEHTTNGERDPYVMDLVLALRRQQGWRLVDEYIWTKTSCFPGKWPNRFRDAWEHLYHFTLSPQFKMRQEAVMVPAQESTKRRSASAVASGEGKHLSRTGSGFCTNRAVLRDNVFPSNVLNVAPVTNNRGHPAPFPDELPEFFIKLFTDADDLVMDPFAGSGTTLRVAERLGRRSVGFELQSEYVSGKEL